MPDVDWITYTRERRGILRARTQHASEPQPFGYGWRASPATRKERDAEVGRRRGIVKEKGKHVAPAEEWVTYQNFNGDLVTHPASELTPKASPLKRIATAKEIRDEEARRKAAKDRISQWKSFRSRPEYKDAEVIRVTLEVMDPDRHPLDRLTPKEWAALRLKIVG